MILAAALSAEGREPPPDLELLWKWRYFQIPPKGGGLLDQTAGQLDRMMAFSRVHYLWDIFINRPKDWRDKLKGKWPVLDYVAWLIIDLKPDGYAPPRATRKMALDHIRRVLKGSNGDKAK